MWGGHRGHNVVAHRGQQVVRARVRAAGKALEEDDRQTDTRSVHYMMMVRCKSRYQLCFSFISLKLESVMLIATSAIPSFRLEFLVFIK